MKKNMKSIQLFVLVMNIIEAWDSFMLISKILKCDQLELIIVVQ